MLTKIFGSHSTATLYGAKETEKIAKEEICQFCKYWKRLNAVIGDCKRESPKIVIKGFGKWPNVRFDDWCGEFKEKENQ